MNTNGVWYGFDSETTSADPQEARIITGALVKIEGGVKTRSEEWIINPGVPIPEESIEIHGLTQTWVDENGADPKVTLETMLILLAKVISSPHPFVVFNAAYDLSVLEAEATRHGLQGLRARVNDDAWHTLLDTYVLGKGIVHNVKHEFKKGQKFTLPALCERFEVPFYESHDATADALGGVLLGQALIKSEPTLQGWTPSRFHRYQRIWRKAQQDSLREYFDKMEKEHDGVDPSWPFYAFVK